MAHYLVKAQPYLDRLAELRAWLDSGEIAAMRPFGQALQHSLENGRLDADGQAVWEEEDYCRPPLAQERAAVLDRYFSDISVEAVEAGDGWNRIRDYPRLWEELS
jgi:hypothetical protein